MKNLSVFMVAVGILLAAQAEVQAQRPEFWWQPYEDDPYTMALWHFDDITHGTHTVFADDDSANPDRSNDGTRPPWSTAFSASGAGVGCGAGSFGNRLAGFNYSSTHIVPDDDTDLEFGTDPNDDFTIEAWIKPSLSDMTGRHGIASKGNPYANGWSFGLNGGKLYFHMRTYQDNFLTSTATADPNNWSHVAVVYDQGFDGGWQDQLTFYINGVEDSTHTSPNIDGTPINNSHGILIGVGDMSNSWEFSGQLDEIRLSNVARHYEGLLCGGCVVSSDLNLDCAVNLEDLAKFSVDWMKCSNAGDDSCTQP